MKKAGCTNSMYVELVRQNVLQYRRKTINLNYTSFREMQHIALQTIWYGWQNAKEWETFGLKKNKQWLLKT